MQKRTSWSKELIIKRIKEYESRGVILRGYIIKDIDYALYRSSIRYFGSWKNAVESSGFEYKISVPNKISVEGDTKRIIITRRNGEEITVFVDSNIELNSNIYMSSEYPRISVKGEDIYLHKYIFGNVREGNEIDHLDRNPLNCKLENLREVTPTQNQYNKKAKGYYKDGNKWRSRMSINGKEVNIGSFDTEKEASEAYKSACVKYRKEYAPIEYN